ncbi:MAG: spore maturation protein A [Clostridia bacterium]|nr:spore maturation protein A [Clostridia bacterium]
MMNKLFAAMIIAGCVVGIVCGRGAAVSEAVFRGAAEAVELLITIGGAVCLWSGLMRLIERSDMLGGLCRLIAPAMRRLFPDIPPRSPAMTSIVMNIAANLLGLANAATPIGMRAMEQMKALSGGSNEASRSMIMFVVMNTASFQLLSSSLMALRIEAGSRDPFEVMAPIWIASGVCLASAVIMAKLCSIFKK